MSYRRKRDHLFPLTKELTMTMTEATSATSPTSITSGTLIAADKVQGTNVYNRAGDKLGSVDDIMIDKVSGHAIYAVMSFGGFLGMDKKYHPLPWGALKYDAQKGGYVVNP